MPKLSILICTLKNRKHFYDRLIYLLRNQCDVNNLWNYIELLSEYDDGEDSIGKKRNLLLERAKGDYVVFIDDDDLVSNDYVKLILSAIDKSSPDVVGIHLLMTVDGKNEERTYHSLKYRNWWDEQDPDRPGRRRYFRNPNHLNPVKRSIAIQVRFPEVSVGEDKDYSMRMLPYLNTEEYIECPIYHYLYRSK